MHGAYLLDLPLLKLETLQFEWMAVAGWMAVAVVAMVLGFLWFGPLFGKAWMRAMGWDPNDAVKMEEMKKSAGAAYGMMMANAIVLGFLVWVTLGLVGVSGWMDGALFAFIASLTFQATASLSTAIWGGSKSLFLINASYYTLSHAIAGGIVGALV